jgi:hypothetical protein
MSDSETLPPANRSAASLHFESVLRAASRGETIPRLIDVDFARLRPYAPWIAIIDADNEARSLKFSLVGQGLTRLLGRELLGSDYLDLVDPAIRDTAFDSVFLMFSRPCGLWQTTPATTAGGATETFEYTGYPVLDHVKGTGQIMFLIHSDFADAGTPPRVSRIERATNWRWLDAREHAVA